MSQYGETAILATHLYREGKATSPEDAWEMAAQKTISSGESQTKGCPKGAYLGLCAAELVRGVPRGNYVKSESKEKCYVTTAVELLRQEPRKTKNLSALWREVLAVLATKGEADPGRSHQGEMNVVVELWEHGDIIR